MTRHGIRDIWGPRAGFAGHGEDPLATEPTAANELTLTDWDPVSKQPQFKFAAVSAETA